MVKGADIETRAEFQLRFFLHNTVSPQQLWQTSKTTSQDILIWCLLYVWQYDGNQHLWQNMAQNDKKMLLTDRHFSWTESFGGQSASHPCPGNFELVLQRQSEKEKKVQLQLDLTANKWVSVRKSAVVGNLGQFLEIYGDAEIFTGMAMGVTTSHPTNGSCQGGWGQCLSQCFPIVTWHQFSEKYTESQHKSGEEDSS